ncbi:nitrite reductase small subunit NirD [Actinocorallia longicatena]|uniref:Nitrite reductase small subunit NirD n=1 Tax=Actinocorallia longicatena TaxID=111803 RepID=A0ABP6PX05_9ACTN
MTALTLTTSTDLWTDVCAYDDLVPERGVCALVGGEQIAIFRTLEGDLYALSNLDPFSDAYVLSRGILGCRGGVATVASPMYKNVFALETGLSLDDPERSVRAYPVRLADGRVEVST